MKFIQNLPCTPQLRGNMVVVAIVFSLLSTGVLRAQEPSSVTLPGSFQSELGCPGDWQPSCTFTDLTFDPADGVWQGTFAIPAGAWEYKAAIDGSWDENYGANAQPNGANILLNLPAGEDVKFYYDHETHWITDHVNAVIATLVGNFQSELGCPGDWQPDCLQSWLQDPDGDGIYTFATDMIPAGSYAVKVAHDESWDENYGAGGVLNGENIPFDLPFDGKWVFFAYDPVTHILDIFMDDQPASVTIAGNLQSELGCPGDWQPECNSSYLAFYSGDAIWRESFLIPAGSWEYKAALNDSWDENYGANAQANGPNIPLNLVTESEVRFYYDHKTHWVTDNVNSVIAVVTGDFQDELGGCFDWDPSCMNSWLQDPDGDGLYTFFTTMIPPGPYAAKVAHNESWDENYGEGGIPGGNNILFDVPFPGAPMLFQYDPVTHLLTISLEEPPPGLGSIIVHKVTDPPSTDIGFLFTSPHMLSVNAPAEIAGDYPAGSAFFGPPVSFTGIPGELELVDDAVDPVTNGCEPLSGFTPGKIAVVDRGTCTFVSKVLHAQDAGAIGVVVVNNIEGGGILNMGGEGLGVTIPAILISYEDGILIKAAMEEGPVAATLRSAPTGNFILAHDEIQLIENIPAGNYSIRELQNISTGFKLSHVFFEDPDGGSFYDPMISGAMIDLDPGETVICHFINTGCANFSAEPFGLTFDLVSGATATGTISLDNFPDPGGQDLFYTVVSPFADDFESYIAGEQLACQNPAQWTTWSGNPCTPQDAFITTAQAQSGNNSVLIDRATTGFSVGQVKPLGNQGSGVWELAFSIYIPEGKAGFFRILSSFKPDPVIGTLDCALDPGGMGLVMGGSPDGVPFNFEHDAWQRIQVIADLEADEGQFWIEGEMIHSWTWTDGMGGGGPLQLAAANFYAATLDHVMYVDDLEFHELPHCSFIKAVSPQTALIPEGESADLIVEVDATGYPTGTYTCGIIIVGNACTGNIGLPVTINVTDTEPPVIHVKDPAALWPANHKYQGFSLGDMVLSVTDNADGEIPVEMVNIDYATSDEPDDAPGNGDGKTTNDIVIGSGCKSVDLRKERQGGGNGRVYQVSLSVSDAAGNLGTATYQVTVPHDQNGMAVDDGPDHTVYGPCGGNAPLRYIDQAGNPRHYMTTFPNPFSGMAKISFSLLETEAVRLKVYNSLGEEVANLYNGIAEAGIIHTVEFDAKALPGGVYYSKLQLNNGEFILRKMVLIK